MPDKKQFFILSWFLCLVSAQDLVKNLTYGGFFYKCANESVDVFFDQKINTEVNMYTSVAENERYEDKNTECSKYFPMRKPPGQLRAEFKFDPCSKGNHDFALFVNEIATGFILHRFNISC
ncbi:uncharacterized protein LOC123266628 [Cotesia glomerata]|uniref:Uncharacterized protein n=1 Tax=Cotesia glomerata TaxID=32391 RepID=A0AAV7HTN2_COTGL|nr:uncharacterized protein LOC123266628 [Cotesia glomerata]KAH0535470.1 hypothetical protein KQX54_016659 [Cotesia glomerata]